MFSKVCVLLLAIGLSQAVPQMYMPEAGFMQFMLKSRALSQNNPGRSLDCFDVYLPKLADVSSQYKEDYAQCLSLADEAREQIDDTTQDDRKKIDGEATNACSLLTTCSKHTSSLEYFGCYADAGSQNTKTMYTISADSSELLAVVTEEYRLIDNNQYLCTNKSDRVYVENTAKVYSELEACLSGKDIATDSTAAPDTTASTADPTTEESSSASTAEDSSTDSSSESTTEASTTEESSSEASTTEESTSEAPTSEASTTEESTSEASTSEESTTSSSSEVTDADKENLPEEDLSRIAQEQKKMKNVLEDLKKWLKRH